MGAFATLRRGHVAETCISAEPTGAEVISANAGSLTFRLVVSGLSTHGSTRTRGVSAIELFEHVHAALRELEARRNATSAPGFEHLDLPWPLSVGTITAGDWASTVPDRLVAEGRYGVRVDETVADAVADLETAVAWPVLPTPGSGSDRSRSPGPAVGSHQVGCPPDTRCTTRSPAASRA